MSIAGSSLLVLAALQAVASPVDSRDSTPSAGTLPATLQMSGRDEDARVAQIAFHLAVAGRDRCPVPAPAIGLTLQHLSQFKLADRPRMIGSLRLDRGPAAIAVVPGGPAARAGIRAGDVLLAIDGNVLPSEPALEREFDASLAHARADTIHDLLARAGVRPFTVALLRQGDTHVVRITATPACPSRVHLARSSQRNGYADGARVFLTTGLLSQLRNDDELAFLIAHEMAHNILGHATIMHSQAVKGGIGRTLGRSGKIIRQTEREADALAGDLMMDAGFDAVRGIEILRRLGGADLGIALFATHAPARERISAMQAQARVRQSQ